MPEHTEYLQNEDVRSEAEPQATDISQEFLRMDGVTFRSFLQTESSESALSITIDWVDVMTARRLKAFLETAPEGQKRLAKIRATRSQYLQELNVFGSGVTWEEVAET
jgi:hypothetical protein